MSMTHVPVVSNSCQRNACPASNTCALLTMIESPGRVDAGQICRFGLPNLYKLILLSTARLDLRSIEFTDRFDTVVDDNSISYPTFIVHTLCRVFIDGHICSFDAQGLGDGGTVDQRGLQKELNEKCE